MIVEQLGLNYEAKKERRDFKTEAIESAIKDYLETRGDSRKVDDASLHAILVGYLSIFKDAILTAPVNAALSPTEKMREDYVIEMLEKIWELLKPILDERGLLYNEKKIKNAIKRPAKKSWATFIERSSPDN